MAKKLTLARTMKVSLLAWVFSLMLACAHVPPGPVQVLRFDATLVYFGRLSAEGLAALKAADNGSANTLLIRSPGGEVGIGMDFGEWVHTRGLNVVVDDACFSSCANYVFTAGADKVILPGGLVAWHGNAHMVTEDELARLPVARQANARAYTRKQQDRENSFFRQVGVDECVARLGRRLGANGLYTMSAEDMHRFGISNVHGAPSRAEDVARRVRADVPVSYVHVPAEVDARKFCE